MIQRVDCIEPIRLAPFDTHSLHEISLETELIINFVKKTIVILDIFQHFVNFFRKNIDHLKNSFVVLMGDHGLRHGGIRGTDIGEVEDNNPLLMVTVYSFVKHWQQRFVKLDAILCIPHWYGSIIISWNIPPQLTAQLIQVQLRDFLHLPVAMILDV